MTLDSLEAYLLAVPLTHLCLSPGDRPEHENCCHDIPDGAALAAAARKWMRERIGLPLSGALTVLCREEVTGYNAALTDVAKALGL